MNAKLIRELGLGMVLACGVLGVANAEPACSQTVCCSCAPAPGTCSSNGKTVQAFGFMENMNNTCTYGSLHTMGTCAIGYVCPHNLYGNSSCNQACSN